MAVHEGSRNHLLLTMGVGERRYYETTLQRYAHDMRTYCTPKTRRPKELAGREFSASLFTAVGHAADIRYLICVERTS